MTPRLGRPPPLKSIVAMCRVEEALRGVGTAGLLNRLRQRPRAQEADEPPPQEPPPRGSATQIDLERARLTIRRENELFMGRIKNIHPPGGLQ